MQSYLHFLTRSLKPEQNPANLEMRDSDPTATFEADCKVIEGFLSRSALQLEACQITPQLEASKGLLSQSTPQLEASEGLLSQRTPQLEAGKGAPIPTTLNLEIDDDDDMACRGVGDAQSPTHSCWSIARRCRAILHTRSWTHAMIISPCLQCTESDDP